MPARGPRPLTLLVPGLVCLGIAAAAGVQLYEGLMRDFYWTPLDSAPSLDQAAPDVEVWVDGDLLQRRAERGELRDARGRTIPPDRITVRLNRRDRVQRAQIALLSGAGGAALGFLCGALALSRVHRRESGTP